MTVVARAAVLEEIGQPVVIRGLELIEPERVRSESGFWRPAFAIRICMCATPSGNGRRQS